MVKLWSVCALFAVVGIGAGWVLRGPGSADANDSATPGTAQVAQLVLSPPPGSARSGLDLAELHAAIKEELAAASRSQPANERQATAVRETVPASAELIAQRREALEDIQGMVASGEWGNGERAQFQQKFAVLDPEQARSVLQQIVRGLNSGTIRAEADLPL